LAYYIRRQECRKSDSIGSPKTPFSSHGRSSTALYIATLIFDDILATRFQPKADTAFGGRRSPFARSAGGRGDHRFLSGAEKRTVWRTGPIGIARLHEPDGQFIVHTIPKWRESNRTVGQFAVTVAFSADVEHPNISAAEMEALKRFADPETTPIHLTISAKKRDGLCIELSEWLSAEEHR
jgi:hypothetical protein